MNKALGGQQSVVSISPKSSKNTFFKTPFVMIILWSLLIAGGVLSYFLLQKPKAPTPTTLPSPSSASQPIDAASSHYIGTQTITLHDVGDGSSSAQITRVFSPGKVEHTIEAILPDPNINTFYQAWAINPERPRTHLGTLIRIAEGKYHLSATYTFSPGQLFTFEGLYNNVVISLETVDDDVIEVKILEGTFTQ